MERLLYFLCLGTLPEHVIYILINSLVHCLMILEARCIFYLRTQRLCVIFLFQETFKNEFTSADGKPGKGVNFCSLVLIHIYLPWCEILHIIFILMVFTKHIILMIH